MRRFFIKALKITVNISRLAFPWIIFSNWNFTIDLIAIGTFSENFYNEKNVPILGWFLLVSLLWFPDWNTMRTSFSVKMTRI